MSIPTFVTEIETAYDATSPKTTAAFDVLSSDVLVVYGITANQPATLTISNTGPALVWTQQQAVNVVNFTWVSIWTTTVSQSAAQITVTFTRVGDVTVFFGGDVLQFRDCGGIGASSSANAAAAAPTLNITTVSQHSAVVVAAADWTGADGVARTWRTGAGTLTETTYFRNAAQMTAYGGYHANAGAIGTYAVGLSAPATQTYSIAAVEVKGATPPLTYLPRPLRMRG